MKKFLFLAFIISFQLSAQQRLDGTFAFQNDPAKKYSIYVPSTYVTGTSNKMMLGLHPWNVNRWDAQSWCDTLTDFAEANSLILVCPDGGLDGQVDDAIDTAFTTALLDSMEVWYSIDTDKVYAMGFSWGGKTTYTYGLSNSDRFGGYIPIGAAINGASEFASVASNANNEAFYVIHGGSDSPNIRFTPVIGNLITNNALVESQLLPGVGHTIDFANRNTILSRAYFWVDSVNCKQLASVSLPEYDNYTSIDIFPNPIQVGETLSLQLNAVSSSEYRVSIINLDGKTVWNKELSLEGSERKLSFSTPKLETGNYIILVQNNQQKFKSTISITQ